MELKLPHLPPVKFAQVILFQDEKIVKVQVVFPCTPTLAMLIESAAQSSAALNLSIEKTKGYLVAMKNIKLHTKATKKCLEVEVIHTHSLANMNMIDFKVYEDSIALASGSLTIALEENKE